jgi:hypothetical protein
MDINQVAWVMGKGDGGERVKVAPRATRALRAYLDHAGIMARSFAGCAPTGAGRTPQTGCERTLPTAR